MSLQKLDKSQIKAIKDELSKDKRYKTMRELAEKCGVSQDAIYCYNAKYMSIKHRIDNGYSEIVKKLIKVANSAKKPDTIKKCAELIGISMHTARRALNGNKEFYEAINRNAEENRLERHKKIYHDFQRQFDKGKNLAQASVFFNVDKNTYGNTVRFLRRVGYLNKPEIKQESKHENTYKTGYNALLTMRLPGHQNEH